MDSIRKLPVATSLFLDLVRFGAAMTVAYGHLTQQFFSSGWTNCTMLAIHSVGIFFLLSGFVIRYVTRLKYHRIGDYWIDRSARIYSVVLPAILFTLIADQIATMVHPGYYLANWPPNGDRTLLRLLTNLTFTSQVWGQSISLFSNGPFWSLSYECFYYVLYGCFFYLTGVRRIFSLLIVAAIAGNHILLLLPLWVLGCVVFDLYVFLSRPAFAKWWLHAGFALAGYAGYLLWEPAYDLLYLLKTMFAKFCMAHHHSPGHFNFVIYYYDVGIPAAFLMLWTAVALSNWTARQGAQTQTGPAESSAWAHAIRIMAEGTFPLYLFHFPLFVVIAAVIPYDHGNSWFKMGMLALAIAVSVVFAGPTNNLKNYLRSLMKKQFMRKKHPGPSETMVAAG